MERIALDVNGYRFDGIAAGPADGVLFLGLHGFPQFAGSWASILESLGTAGYRAVAIDQRGYSPGARPPTVEAYAIRHLVSDAIGFADRLGADRFHLAGHDWGGAVAWALAAHRPERLRSLSILSTPHPDALADAIRNDTEQQRLSAYMLLFGAPAGVAEAYLLADDAAKLRAVYAGKVARGQVESIVQRMGEGGALSAALNWYRAMRDNPPLGPVSVPTLFAWGDADQALGRAAAETTASHCSGRYRFEILARRSHWLPDECPGEIVALIGDHLAGHA